jgi:hypothetical protein
MSMQKQVLRGLPIGNPLHFQPVPVLVPLKGLPHGLHRGARRSEGCENTLYGKERGAHHPHKIYVISTLL